MAEVRIKTDLEERFDAFKKQYQERQAEAARTGKPIPAHTQRWYDKQIEEYRVALKRLGITMMMELPTAREAINRITAVKEELQKKALEAEPVPPEKKAEIRRERVAAYTKTWRSKKEANAKPVVIPTAKMLVAEARIAEAIETGIVSRLHLKKMQQAVRIIQSDLSYEERKALKKKRDNERQNRKRLEKKILALRERTEEVGWVDRQLETDPKMRELFDGYVTRSLNAAIWYRRKHGTPTTPDDIEAMRAHRVFMLKLEVDADHTFLHRIDKLRLESLQRSWKKQYAKLKADPVAWETYSKDRSAAYRKKMASRTPLDSAASEETLSKWMELYEEARLLAMYREKKKDAQKLESAS